MVIVIDIGNTHIVLGGFNNDELMFKSRISTDTKKTEDEYAVMIKNTLSMHNETNNVDGAIISSVVPQLTQVIKDAISLSLGVKAMTVGPGMKTGIKILCDTPSEVGADLICASVAAHEIYNRSTIIVDLGTATKFIVTDDDGSYIGLSIAPGIRMGINALSVGTAQLPQVGVMAPRAYVGKNTADCIKSGVILGHCCMIDGMIDKIIKEVGHDFFVVATGGLADSVIKHCEHKIEINDDLLLKGLKIIYNKNKKEK